MSSPQEYERPTIVVAPVQDPGVGCVGCAKWAVILAIACIVGFVALVWAGSQVSVPPP